MQSLTKRRMSPGRLDALLRSSAGVGCRVEAELTDGWFNTVYRVLLDDDRPAVVRLAPSADVEVLRYERGILSTEAMVYRRLAAKRASYPLDAAIWERSQPCDAG